MNDKDSALFQIVDMDIHVCHAQVQGIVQTLLPC